MKFKMINIKKNEFDIELTLESIFPSSRLIRGKEMEKILGTNENILDDEKTYFIFNDEYDKKYDSSIIDTLKIWEEKNPMDKFAMCIINTSDSNMNGYYKCNKNSIHLTVSVYNYSNKEYDKCLNTIYFNGVTIPINFSKLKEEDRELKLKSLGI